MTPKREDGERRRPGLGGGLLILLVALAVGWLIWGSSRDSSPPSEEVAPDNLPPNYYGDLLTACADFSKYWDDILLIILPTLANDPLFAGLNLQDIKTKQDLDKLELTPEQAGKIIEEVWESTDRQIMGMRGQAETATSTALNTIALAYDEANGTNISAAIDSLVKDPTKLIQATQALAKHELTGAPGSCQDVIASLATQAGSLDNVALEEYLATTGVSDTDIQDDASRAAIAKSGESGAVIFEAAASLLRSEQQVDWADEFVGQRILQAYLPGRDGLTREGLTVEAIRAMSDEELARVKGVIAGLEPELGPDMVALLQEALRRVRASWLPSLEQRVDQLATALAQANAQLDTIQGELQELKQRRDPLPLILALAALVLAAGALGLTVRRRAAA